MQLNSHLQQLEILIQQIEALSIQAGNHRDNANLATGVSALTYVLTSNSKNKTVRTLGTIGAIGGFFYSADQRGKANSIEVQVLQNITTSISLVEHNCMQYIRSERDVNVIKKFLELSLRIGRCLDPIVHRNISRVSAIGFLGKKNQDILQNLHRFEIFQLRLTYNRLLDKIDSGLHFQQVENHYLTLVNQIDKEKLIKEGLYMRIAIISLLIAGFFTATKWEPGIYLFVAGFVLWAFNHFFPVGTESRKLKIAVKTFCTELQGTTGVRQVTLR